jgi:polyisoprenoid-binding protein YceI
VFKSFNVGVLALLLAACGAPRIRHAGPPGPGERAAEAIFALPARNYRIDENQSELRVLVYRAGPLARFGHNHVMVNRAIRGSVNQDPAGASMFSLTVPVAGFVVDDAQARRDEGPDFAGDIPDDAKSGTLRNMLSTAVLDAAEFPSIAVESVAVSGSEDASGMLMATVAIRVAGHESNIDVPFTLESDSRQLSANGSLELRQSALGLIPYSLMLGALQVQDALTVKFKIVASLP